MILLWDELAFSFYSRLNWPARRFLINTRNYIIWTILPFLNSLASIKLPNKRFVKISWVSMAIQNSFYNDLISLVLNIISQWIDPSDTLYESIEFSAKFSHSFLDKMMCSNSYCTKRVDLCPDKLLTIKIDFKKSTCRKISNTRCTKSKSLNDSRIVLQLSQPNPLKPGVEKVEKEDVDGAAPTGATPTTFERSTMYLPTKVRLILETSC